MQLTKLALTLMLLATITGCQTMKPIHTVEYVDLNRFMGDWYVIASIPTFIEKESFNAVEYPPSSACRSFQKAIEEIISQEESDHDCYKPE